MDCTGISNCALSLFLNAGPGLAALVLLGTYLGLLLFARCTWIYRRNHMHLRAYADMVEAQLGVHRDQSVTGAEKDSAVKSQVMTLLGHAREHVPDNKGSSCLTIPGVGRQLAAWRLVHDAERTAVDVLPAEVVQAHAALLVEELKGLGTDTSKALAENISECLEGGSKDDLRQLVKEGRGLIFDARDCYYEDLSDWQNKAVWLVVVTAVILFLVTITMGNSKLLLLGAIGGLLARLRKTMAAKTVGFDYGVSWSVLFLAPLIGALTGWAGVLLAVVFIEPNVLHVPASQFTWTNAAHTEPGMVLAIVFGFSATLFDRVMSGAEAALTKQPAGNRSKPNTGK